MFEKISSHFHNRAQFEYTERLLNQIVNHYGTNLASIAIFGSYARHEARLNSDLDLFIILKNLPFNSRSQVHREFVESIEQPLEESFRALCNSGIVMEASPIILSQQQAKCFNPLYYDMTESILILLDKKDLLKNIIKSTLAMMKKHGSEKVFSGGHWYWKAKQCPKFEEVIDYEI